MKDKKTMTELERQAVETYDTLVAIVERIYESKGISPLAIDQEILILQRNKLGAVLRRAGIIQ